MAETPTQAPILRTGMWVLFDSTSSVRRQLRGKKGVIVRAPISVVEDDLAPHPREAQGADAVFLVRVRDTGEEVQVRQSMFAAVADFPSELGQY